PVLSSRNDFAKTDRRGSKGVGLPKPFRASRFFVPKPFGTTSLWHPCAVVETRRGASLSHGTGTITAAYDDARQRHQPRPGRGARRAADRILPVVLPERRRHRPRPGTGRTGGIARHLRQYPRAMRQRRWPEMGYGLRPLVRSLRSLWYGLRPFVRSLRSLL